MYQGAHSVLVFSRMPRYALVNASQCFAVLEIADAELPVLRLVGEPLLEPLLLLVARDVQHELEDHDPLFAVSMCSKSLIWS